MSDYVKVDRYLEDHLNQSIEELSRLCAQPSVAAQNWGLRETAQMVAEMLLRRGFAVQILETGGAPVVFAERRGRISKTLLFYNHYDVQPAEPLELWHTPPFEPSLRDGHLYARGVSDDKGHLVSRLFALDALLATEGELPCNVKFVVEGEEEVSSVHLPGFVHDHRELLAADACVWEFGGVDHREVPMQYLGLRGICYVELSVETASQDVHSGLGGSIFPNAAWRLVWALNTLKGPDERIRIPNYYDDVVPPSARDRELMDALPEVAEEYKQRYGLESFLKGLTGGVDLRIAEVFEPTCTICGLTSGYQGAGSKTVLPSRASAKVDFRLVPNQTPEKTLKLLRDHLDAEGFSVPGVLFTSAMGAVFNPFWVAVAAGSGAALGELSGYLAGFSGQRVVSRVGIYEKMEGWMRQYGEWVILLLAFVPNPAFDMAGIIAGALRMKVGNFLLWCWIGKVLKMLMFAYGGSRIIQLFPWF